MINIFRVDSFMDYFFIFIFMITMIVFIIMIYRASERKQKVREENEKQIFNSQIFTVRGWVTRFFHNDAKNINGVSAAEEDFMEIQYEVDYKKYKIWIDINKEEKNSYHVGDSFNLVYHRNQPEKAELDSSEISKRRKFLK